MNIAVQNQTMRLLVFRFDMSTQQFITDIVEIEKDIENYNLKDYYNLIGNDCTTVDFVNYDQNDIVIIIDDEGLLKGENPVSELTTPDGSIMQLAGTLIFAKNEYTSDGIGITGLDAGECFKLMTTLNVKLIGIT